MAVLVLVHRTPCRRATGPPGPPGRSRPIGRRAAERGQVLPLVLVAIVLVGVLAAGLVRLGAAVAQGQAAQAAADAAALAGAGRGQAAAEEVAAANGAAVVAYGVDGTDVVVTVTRRGHRRSARARWVPDAAPPGVRHEASVVDHPSLPVGPGG